VIFGRDALPIDANMHLVPRHAGDAAEFFELIDANRAALREWLGWVDATRSVADVRRYAHYAEAQFESRISFDYAIRTHAVLAGAIGLHALDWSNRCAQIGYWLAPEARGRGTMSRAASTLVTHAFRDLLLHRVEIRCAVDNQRSRAIPERLGFLFEGTLAGAHVLQGRFHDIALYAMTAPRWHRSKDGA
jgi:ribosomal-protein-serine acetyltransferase